MGSLLPIGAKVMIAVYLTPFRSKTHLKEIIKVKRKLLHWKHAKLIAGLGMYSMKLSMRIIATFTYTSHELWNSGVIDVVSKKLNRCNS